MPNYSGACCPDGSGIPDVLAALIAPTFCDFDAYLIPLNYDGSETWNSPGPAAGIIESMKVYCDLPSKEAHVFSADIRLIGGCGGEVTGRPINIGCAPNFVPITMNPGGCPGCEGGPFAPALTITVSVNVGLLGLSARRSPSPTCGGIA